MRDIKKIILRVFFATEIVLFLTFYLVGSQGLQALMRMNSENNQLQQEIGTLTSAVNQVAMEIEEWKKYPFFKEKIARERLHMAYPGDELYMIITTGV